MSEPNKVEVTELKRVFVHDGAELKDPAPGQPPEKALEILALADAKLNNAVVEPPKAEDGKLKYPIKINVGTKG
jgi:PRTRC genetic system protein C